MHTDEIGRNQMVYANLKNNKMKPEIKLGPSMLEEYANIAKKLYGDCVIKSIVINKNHHVINVETTSKAETFSVAANDPRQVV